MPTLGYLKCISAETSVLVLETIWDLKAETWLKVIGAAVICISADMQDTKEE
jgi:hypothetical protein